MVVRALRIAVLKSAGNFTRDECRNLSAEKVRRVKLFCARGARFVARRQFSNTGAVVWVRKFQVVVFAGSGGLRRHDLLS
jgi:hypothetical protein